MINRSAAKVHELLQKCSKEVLIDLIIRAMNLTYATFPWQELIGNAKIAVIDRKIEEAKAKSDELRKQLDTLPENEKVLTNHNALQLMIDLKKSNDEYMKLLNRYIAIEKEIYG